MLRCTTALHGDRVGEELHFLFECHPRYPEHCPSERKQPEAQVQQTPEGRMPVFDVGQFMREHRLEGRPSRQRVVIARVLREGDDDSGMPPAIAAGGWQGLPRSYAIAAESETALE